MRDIVIERIGFYAADFRRQVLARTNGAYDGRRCPVCRCIPRAQWTHKVSDEARARTGFEMFTTCDSHYCRSKDPA